MEKEILEALKKIQKVCSDNNCVDCPFADNEGTCYISERYPKFWQLRERLSYFEDKEEYEYED